MLLFRKISKEISSFLEQLSARYKEGKKYPIWCSFKFGIFLALLLFAATNCSPGGPCSPYLPPLAICQRRPTLKSNLRYFIRLDDVIASRSTPQLRYYEVLSPALLFVTRLISEMFSQFNKSLLGKHVLNSVRKNIVNRMIYLCSQF